jgi:hypothetical protein
MGKTSLINLDLRSPLLYLSVKNLPSKFNENDEFLLYYELDPVQSQSIEPVREQLPCFLVFSGVKTDDNCQPQGGLTAEEAALPAGKYLFTQSRSLSDEISVNFYTDWLDLAIEQQKDGLWERYKLTNKLYVRYLFEDGKFVTQIFRVIS